MIAYPDGANWDVIVPREVLKAMERIQIDEIIQIAKTNLRELVALGDDYRYLGRSGNDLSPFL